MTDTGKKAYGSGLTSGSLLVRESRIVARMLVEGETPADIKKKILDNNLFQNSSPTTTRKYSRLILSRLQHLNSAQLRIVAEGVDESASLMVFAAVLKTYSIVRDFVTEVMFDKVRSYEPNLERKDWTLFLEQRVTIEPAVGQWKESSQKKVGEVVIRMLAEAGFLSNTRSMAIQFPRMPFDVADSLLQSSDGHVLECLKLGKAA